VKNQIIFSVILPLLVLACGGSPEPVMQEEAPRKGGLVVVDSPCGILDVRWDPNGDPAGTRIYVASSCMETDYSEWPYGDDGESEVDDLVDASVEPVDVPSSDAEVPAEEVIPPTVEVRQDSPSAVRVWMRSYTGNLHVTHLEGTVSGTEPPVVDAIGAGGYAWHQVADACTVSGQRYVCEVSVTMDAGYVRLRVFDGDLTVDIINYTESAR